MCTEVEKARKATRLETLRECYVIATGLPKKEDIVNTIMGLITKMGGKSGTLPALYPGSNGSGTSAP